MQQDFPYGQPVNTVGAREAQGSRPKQNEGTTESFAYAGEAVHNRLHRLQSVLLLQTEKKVVNELTSG